jgi:Tol biopolymer transport system component
MPEDTHEDVRRRLFDAAWEVSTFAPAPERTVTRARRRAAMTISGAVAAAAMVAAAVVLSAGGILGMDADRSATNPRHQDPREYLVNVTTGQRTEFRELPPGAWLYEFSPDGSQLAFVADTTGSNQVWVMNIDGGGLRQVTHDDYEATDPDWSPDGRRIAYVGFGDGRNREVFVADHATGKTRRVTKGPTDPWNPDWSPDGEHILYHERIKTASGPAGAFTSNETSVRVNSVEVATRRVRTLAGGKSSTRAWDGTWVGPDRILFMRFSTGTSSPDPNLGLWVMQSDGSRKELLLSVAADEAYAPAWSPDGHRVAYVRAEGDAFHIHIFDLSTGQDRSITRGQFATWVDDDTLLVQEALPALD